MFNILISGNRSTGCLSNLVRGTEHLALRARMSVLNQSGEEQVKFRHL